MKSSENLKALKPKAIEFLITNICFPCKLPQENYSSDLEFYLLKIIYKAIKPFNKTQQLGYFSSHISLILRIFNRWKELQKFTIVQEEKITETIKSLTANDTFVLYVRQQNACFMITKLSQDSQYPAVVSTFQASAKNEEVMGTSSDLSSQFPSSSYYIKSLKIVESKIFGIQLANLTNTEIDSAFSTSSKRGIQNKEIRDVCYPRFIAEWLMAVLSPNSFSSPFPRPVVKKIRDDVLWKNTLMPFRRSGMWMCIKAVLNLVICNAYEENYGKVFYKVIMCQVIKELCKYSSNLEVDLQLQMIQKLSKKLYKLDKFPKDEIYNNLLSFCIEECYNVIRDLREKMDSSFQFVCRNSRNSKAELDMLKISPSDKFHRNLACGYEITRLMSIKFYSKGFSEAVPKSPWRFNSKLSIPDLTKLKSNNEEDLLIGLYDIENMVRYNLNELKYDNDNITKLYNLLESYIEKAKYLYVEDPLGYSRFILTVTNLIILLDKLAINQFPMLSEHKIGIDSDFIQYLLLPTSSDMSYAYETKEYIDRRNTMSKFPSLIDTQNNSENSFASRYYQKNQEMKAIKVKIINEAVQKCNSKSNELISAIDMHISLKNQSDELECEYVFNYKRARNFHKKHCRKCMLLRESNNITLSIYEWPLPICNNCLYKKVEILKNKIRTSKCHKCKIDKRIVIFELKIPLIIAHLRDSLHLFLTQVIYFKSNKVYAASSRLETTWINHQPLSKHSKLYQKRTTFGSNSKLFSVSHYNSNKVHRSSVLDDFIRPNGCYVQFSDFSVCNIQYNIDYASCIYLCCHQISGIYKNLQFCLNWVDHNENQVIAKQNDCHKDLKLPEFFKYGCFRAGGNLQMLNLLDAIETRGLSFEKQSVFLLITQSLWQIGPLDTSSFIKTSNFNYPIFHSDLSNGKFMTQIHSSLDTYLSLITKKWNDHIILLNIIIISTRLMSLSPPEIQFKFTQLVLKCRKIALDWKQTIEAVLLTAKNFSEDLIKQVNEKLFEICCFGILSYKIDNKFIHLILNTAEDITDWLVLMSKIYDFNVLLNINFNNGTFRKNLIRLVKQCVIDVETQFTSVSNKNSEGFNEFIKIKWALYAKGKTGGWSGYSDSSFFKCDFKLQGGSNRILQVGIDGTFLVDGQPIGKLPKTISSNPLFKMYFEDTDFDVQPGDQGVGTFVTEKRKIYEGCSVSYIFFEVNKELIIKELAEKTDSNNNTAYIESQLIPQSALKGSFPKYFAKNFSHWLIISDKILEFRPRTLKDQNEKKVSYKLDLNSQTIYDNNQPDKYLINIKSQTFDEIYYKIIGRLELRHHVHVYTTDDKISIELPRFNLSFNVHGDAIKSNEYRGMIVSKIQQIDTLLGLEQGLVLCEDKIHDLVPIKRKLIVPHGKLIAETGNGHQNVHIDIKWLRKPPFMCFDIDDRLRILRAGESITAWVYLAWLHGLTSSALEDPFLKQTGTSRSLQILQSGNCWSCRPLSKEDFDTLLEISKLSPIRTYYPSNMKSMQSVTWPKSIPSLAAHESFQYIVQKLLDDSNKLKYAFKILMETPDFLFEIKSNQILSRKAYIRHRRFNHTLNENFENIMGNKDKILHIYNNKLGSNMENVKKIVLKKYQPKISIDLVKFLKSENLRGKTVLGYYYLKVTDWINRTKDIVNDWIDLYCLIKENTLENKIKFKMILSLYAYEEADLKILIFLKILSIFKENIKGLNPPSYNEYILFDSLYKSSSIITILEKNYMSHEKFRNRYRKQNLDEDYEKYCARCYKEYTEKKKIDCSKEEEKIQINWDNYKSSPRTLMSQDFNHECIQKISIAIELWNRNFELLMFIKDLEGIFYKLPRNSAEHNFSQIHTNSLLEKKYEPFDFLIDLDYNQKQMSHILENPFEELDLKRDTPNRFELENSQEFPYKIHEDGSVKEFMLKELKISWDIYKKTISNTQVIPEDLNAILEEHKNYCDMQILRIQSQLDAIYSPINALQKALYLSNIWPSTNPNARISNILKENIDNKVKLNEDIIDLIRDLGVIWVNDQRILRCFTYHYSRESMRTALQREIIDVPHKNWIPKERPEWLLLEIEMDIMIRPIQVEVAEHMMKPKNNTNHVMQLNMGEGKTSVIIPMLASVLADTDKLVRVIVLRSLFNTNFNSLVYKMGGILNRRVYAFPCRRDIKFNEANVKAIKSLYEECKRKKGIVIALPEHILSFHLKGLEQYYKGDLNLGESLINLQNWLEKHSRDILDESDEILSVKYQLVYSIGKQSSYAEGNLRWEVSQAVLSLAKNHFEYLKEKYGANDIETYTDTEYSMAYPYFRLLNYNPYRELCELICTDILKGKSTEICFLELKGLELDAVRNFILCDEVNEETRNEVKNIFTGNTIGWNIVLILRGLFTYEVLYSSLTKRWRVDFGVKLDSKSLLQAVPYRAKDLPAERAQFEHPDVMILLTQFSYYYSGLSDAQLDVVFGFLSNYSFAAQEYENWIKYLPNNIQVHPSIKEFSGINLSDLGQKYEILYPAMRRHPVVINFWLNKFLYPKEGKQFCQKLSKSAWDICRTKKNPLTGFSGTKDLKILLPCNTEYFQIPELEYTSGSLISHLLLPENNNYNQLKPDILGTEILETIKTIPNLRLLLDVGALMLNLTNKKVAEEWLKLRPDIEAAVYFENNDLVVINRNRKVTSFELSTYRRHLDNCVIYLDDSHTRGTDLKIPRDTIGAVTLGKGVTKDRLMQACMRMRMLGDGHTVRFYSSNEVHNQILKLKTSDSSIGSSEVIEWAINNSSDQIADDFLYWATQGLSFYRKEVLRDKFTSDQNYDSYIKFSIETQKLEIQDLYNPDRQYQPIKNIVQQKIHFFNGLIAKSSINLVKNFEDKSSVILERIIEYVNSKSRYGQLHDEEAEVELEVEQEQEREIERPKAAMAKTPYLDHFVKVFVSEGSFTNSKVFRHLPLGLKESSLYHVIQPQAWSRNLYVTEDFCNTVNASYSGDDYLRSPRWIAARQNKDESILVFLSGFETSKVKKLFCGPTSLIMIMPRSRQDQLKFFSTSDIQVPLNLLEQLSIFSGSQYFQTIEEQNAYNLFIGYCPTPRTEFQQDCFERNMIYKNGYVKPQHRSIVFKEIEEKNLSNFTKDPIEFLIKLTEIRNYGRVSKFSHHLSILLRGRNPLE